jgi:hypothetical protein
MPDWQERITRETGPGIRVEHELRYRAVAPLIARSTAWADLGCGTGVAAAAALDDGIPPHTILVDNDQGAVASAARELGATEAIQVVGDLTDRSVLESISEALSQQQGDHIVTCFEVIEHLETFVPLVEWATVLARESPTTFVLSVPNDAFSGVDNPYHKSIWSEQDFEALRRLLPQGQTSLFRQVSLSGSAAIGWDETSVDYDITTEVGGHGTVATHFIAAFGARHQEMRPGALAAQTDLLGQRLWERQRESDVAFAEHKLRVLQEAIDAQDGTIAAQQSKLREHVAQFDEWRAYIHKLEHELGQPLSGDENQGQQQAES